MAGSCVVTDMLLITRYSLRQNPTLLLPIALLTAAGFESSIFVGGITFALAGLIAAPILFGGVDRQWRLRFVGGLMIAALLVARLIAPFVRDQLAAVHARDAGNPVVIAPYSVFGERFPVWLRRVLDVPGYWLTILPIELPAAFIAGVIALAAALRSAIPRSEKFAIAVFACLAGTGLIISWLLASTLGENNDLGLRAIIPAEIVLIAMAAAAAAGLPSVPRRDRGDRARGASTQPPGLRSDSARQHHRHASAARCQSVCAKAGIVGGDAPRRRRRLRSLAARA
jgi:hypothetical protein